jgi:CYTH domain-containing protein
MNKYNLEIERKFLLRNVPKFERKEVDKFLIHQIYVNVDGKVTRFRMTEKFNIKGSDPVVERTYVKCVKKPISTGVFEEVENVVSQELFEALLKQEHSYIVKTRYLYEHGGLKWEVDEYHDIKLVTLEVELDDINQDITIPEIIEREMIVEVTGQRVFSNFELSVGKESVI